MELKDFQAAVAAARRGERAEARKLMRRVLLDYPSYAPAWIWMSGLLDDLQQQQECLERALALDPSSKPAQEGLNILRLRSFLSSLPEPVEPVAPPEPQQIGIYLVDRGFISQEQLNMALMEQHMRRNQGAEYTMLGDILVQRGWLTPRALASALVSQQQERVTSTEGERPQRLGSYMLIEGLITPAQLAAMLAEQARLRYAEQYILLGELLVHNGYITPRQLEQVLANQFKDLMGQSDIAEA